MAAAAVAAAAVASPAVLPPAVFSPALDSAAGASRSRGVGTAADRLSTTSRAAPGPAVAAGRGPRAASVSVNAERDDVTG
ncbi:hypothetical protein GCM10023203_52840 [Actinomycetospora straminea]|uniref:Secreted protein n=1 Tax=Actinomycetospora straminea TaxID=663607 RepID=A0ABP9F338_9PSEU